MDAVSRRVITRHPALAANERHIILIGRPKAPLANDSFVGWSYCARPDKPKWILNVRLGIKKRRNLAFACCSRAREKNTTVQQFVRFTTTECSFFKNLPALALFPRAPLFLRVPTNDTRLRGTHKRRRSTPGDGETSLRPDTGKRG